MGTSDSKIARQRTVCVGKANNLLGCSVAADFPDASGLQTQSKHIGDEPIGVSSFHVAMTMASHCLWTKTDQGAWQNRT